MPLILDSRECSKIKSSFCDPLASNLRNLVFESRAMLNTGSPTLERSVAVWSDPSGAPDYLKVRCQSAWLREVKTHHVQSWLEEIAREHEISKTTLKHVKNFLSGVFRHAAQQGFFDGANPVKLAEVQRWS
jgi:hypothetical protein